MKMDESRKIHLFFGCCESLNIQLKKTSRNPHDLPVIATNLKLDVRKVGSKISPRILASFGVPNTMYQYTLLTHVLNIHSYIRF